MFRRSAMVAWALLASACAVNGDFGGTSYLCSDGVCPAGQECVSGVCVRPVDAGTPLADGPLGDAGVADAAVPDPDAAPAEPCGSPGVASEGFEGSDVGPLWDWSFTSAPATRTVSGGHGVITLAENSSGNHYAGFATEYFVDLTSSRAFVEVPVMANVATAAQAMFILERGTNDRLIFLQEGGQLYATVRTDGADTDEHDAPFDPIAHRWWQIRHEPGAVVFETSADGVSWDLFFEAPAPWYIYAVRVQLAGGTYLAEVGVGEIHYDNFMGGGVPTAAWCKTGSRSDDFEDGSTGSLWARAFGSACVRAETGGQLVFSPATGASNFCGNASGTKYDLTGSTAAVEVVASTAPVTGATTFFKVETDNENGDFIGFAVEELDRLNMRYGIDGVWTEVNDLPYDPVAHRFWRLRQAGTSVFFEVSANGTDWSDVGSTANPFDLTALDVVIGAGASDATEDPGDALFDNYNRLP